MRCNQARGRRVLVNSFLTHVRNGHDDQWLDLLLPDQSLRGFIEPPFDTGKRSGGIKNILPVVQIQNRIARARKTTVTRRQINEHVSTIPQNPGWKSAMQFDVSGEGVFAFQIQTLRLSFRACREISLLRPFVNRHSLHRYIGQDDSRFTSYDSRSQT